MNPHEGRHVGMSSLSPRPRVSGSTHSAKGVESAQSSVIASIVACGAPRVVRAQRGKRTWSTGPLASYTFAVQRTFEPRSTTNGEAQKVPTRAAAEKEPRAELRTTVGYSS